MEESGLSRAAGGSGSQEYKGRGSSRGQAQSRLGVNRDGGFCSCSAGTFGLGPEAHQGTAGGFEAGTEADQVWVLGVEVSGSSLSNRLAAWREVIWKQEGLVRKF